MECIQSVITEVIQRFNLNFEREVPFGPALDILRQVVSAQPKNARLLQEWAVSQLMSRFMRSENDHEQTFKTIGEVLDITESVGIPTTEDLEKGVAIYDEIIKIGRILGNFELEAEAHLHAANILEEMALFAKSEDEEESYTACARDHLISAVESYRRVSDDVMFPKADSIHRKEVPRVVDRLLRAGHCMHRMAMSVRQNQEKSEYLNQALKCFCRAEGLCHRQIEQSNVLIKRLSGKINSEGVAIHPHIMMDISFWGESPVSAYHKVILQEFSDETAIVERLWKDINQYVEALRMRKDVLKCLEVIDPARIVRVVHERPIRHSYPLEPGMPGRRESAQLIDQAIEYLQSFLKELADLPLGKDQQISFLANDCLIHLCIQYICDLEGADPNRAERMSMYKISFQLASYLSQKGERDKASFYYVKSFQMEKDIIIDSIQETRAAEQYDADLFMQTQIPFEQNLVAQRQLLAGTQSDAQAAQIREVIRQLEERLERDQTRRNEVVETTERDMHMILQSLVPKYKKITELLKGLGDTYKREGDLDKAIEMYAQLVHLYEQSTSVLKDIQGELGLKEPFDKGRRCSLDDYYSMVHTVCMELALFYREKGWTEEMKYYDDLKMKIVVLNKDQF